MIALFHECKSTEMSIAKREICICEANPREHGTTTAEWLGIAVEGERMSVI